MNKNLPILIMIGLIFYPLVLGAIPYSNILSHIDFNDGTPNDVYNLSIFNSNCNATVVYTSNSSCLGLGGCVGFDGGECIDITNETKILGVGATYRSVGSITMWVKLNIIGSQRHAILEIGTNPITTNFVRGIYDTSDDGWAWDSKQTSSYAWERRTITGSSGSWFLFTVTHNGTHPFGYVSNSTRTLALVGAVNNSLGTWFDDININIGRIGRQTNGVLSLKGFVDEVTFWDKALTEAEINELAQGVNLSANNWGNGTVGAYGLLAVNFSQPPTPLDNSHNNTQVNISMACNGTNPRYTLYFDNTSGVTIALDNSTTSYWVTNVTLNAHYYYKAYCSNATSNSSTNSSVRNWYYDSTDPVLTVANNNEFNINNYSQLNPYDDIMNLSFNLSDNIGLYGFEVNVYRLNGSLYYNNITTGLGSATSFNYRQFYNISNWSNGRYYVNVSLSDTHTSTAISDYQYTKSSDNLQFSTAEGNNIKISADNSISTDTSKQTDRYTFSFEFNKEIPVSNRVFYVESQNGEEINYYPESPYKAHFVIFNHKTKKGNWIDFEGINGKPEVKQISKTIYTVTFPVTDEKITFNSIGGLNIIYDYFSFYKGSYTTVNPIALTGDTANISITLSKDDTFDYWNSSLYYSGSTFDLTRTNATNQSTFYKVVTIPSANGSLNYFYNFSLNQSDNTTFKINLSVTQTIIYWNLTICNTNVSNTTTARFIIYDEEQPATKLNASVDLEIVIWANESGNNKTLNFNLTGNNTYDLCLYNSYQLRSNAYATYKTDYGFTHRYYWFNHTLNTTIFTSNMYNFNRTTGVSDLKMTCRDINDYNYYPNLLVQLERRYLDEGIYRIVQMDLSDDYGFTFFNVIEESVDYRLKFYNTNNELLKTADNLIFSCTSTICELTALVNPSGATGSTEDLGVTYTYNNVTKIVTINWNDPNNKVSSVRIYVAKPSITGDSVICNTTIAGSSGSYNCNVTGNSGQIFLRVWKTASPESTGFMTWIDLRISSLKDVLKAGDPALISFIFLVVIVMLGIFSPSASIMFSIVGLIFIAVLGIFSAITYVVIAVTIVMGVFLMIKMRR